MTLTGMTKVCIPILTLLSGSIFFLNIYTMIWTSYLFSFWIFYLFADTFYRNMGNRDDILPVRLNIYFSKLFHIYL